MTKEWCVPVSSDDRTVCAICGNPIDDGERVWRRCRSQLSKTEARARRESALTEGAGRLGVTLADVGHYAHAVLRWSAAGWPTRTDEEVAAILAVCRDCDQFADGRCKSCGCKINASRWALANKAQMATESCPLRLW